MYSKSRNTNKAPVAQKISPVTVALLLVSGERLIAEFHPEVTLWDILQHWENDCKLEPPLASLASDIPVGVYFRREIATKEMLQTCTLLKLGIENGKVTIRYITKKPGVTDQAHVGGTIAPTPRAPSPEAPKRKEIQKVDLENKKEEAPIVVPQQVTETVKQESIETVAQPQTHSDASQETKPLDIAQETKPLDAAQETKPLDAAQETKPLDAAQENTSHDDTKVTSPEAKVNQLPSSGDPQANEVEVSLELEETVYFLNEQGALVYLPPTDIISTSNRVHTQEESDEFFELTEEEVRRMMNDLITQNSQLQDAPLITAQLRREQEEKRRLQMLEKYPTTVLRIQFSDRFILQMPVPSKVTLGEVKKQLIEYFEVSIEVDHFELFTTPPKQVIETSSSLHQIGLTPSSLVYISSHCVLKEKFRLNPSCYAGAVRDASRRLNRSGKTSAIHTANTSKSGASVASVTTNDQRPKRPASDTAAATATANKNVPKWLKLNR